MPSHEVSGSYEAQVNCVPIGSGEDGGFKYQNALTLEAASFGNSEEFYTTATVFWTAPPLNSIGFQVRLLDGSNNILWVGPEATGSGMAPLDPENDFAFSLPAQVINEVAMAAEGTGGLKFQIWPTALEPPIPRVPVYLIGTVTGTWTVGADWQAENRYHLQTVLGDEVSDWTASGDLRTVHDNEFGAAGVAYAGVDYDADEINSNSGVHFWDLTAFSYAPVPEPEISGLPEEVRRAFVRSPRS